MVYASIIHAFELSNRATTYWIFAKWSFSITIENKVRVLVTQCHRFMRRSYGIVSIWIFG